MGSYSSFRGKMVTVEFIVCIDYCAASQYFNTTEKTCTTFAGYSSKGPGD